MRGLVYKEFFSLMGIYKKNLILIATCYGILAVALENDFFLFFGIWMMGFYGLTGFTMDTQCGWNRYARVLPLQDWKVVAAKFLAGLLYTAIGVAYSLVMGVVSRLVSGTLARDWRELLASIGVITALAVAMMGLVYFFAVKFGPDKARNYFVAILLVLFGVFVLLGRSGLIRELPAEEYSQLAAWLDSHMALLVLLALALSMSVLLACLLAACAVYRKKEF